MTEAASGPSSPYLPNASGARHAPAPGSSVVPGDSRYAPVPDDSRESVRTVALIDLLDRVLAGGVVISGDITLSIEGVDLVHISLRALVTSVSAQLRVESS